MTQFDPPYEMPDQPTQPKMSGLAIASLVCSLIFCCPVTTVLGVILGIVAYISIGSNPMRRGRGLALAGILIGIVATVLVIGLGVWGYQNFQKPVEQGPDAAFAAAFAGNGDAFRDAFYGPASQASDQDVNAFVDELRSRYGDYVGMHLDRGAMAADPPSFEEMMQPRQTYPYVIEFQNETVQAEITASNADPSTGEFFWTVKFSDVRIIDEARGDVVFPADGSQPGAGAENDPSTESDAP